MTAIPRPLPARPVPDRLAGPLRRVARRHWNVLAAVSILKTLIAGLVALLAAAMLLGYFQWLWMPVRIAIAVIAWAVVIGSAVRFLRPVLYRWGLSRAAMHVESRLPALQERLSSAVELSAESDPAFRGSPALIDHLVRQAEADARMVRPELVVPADRIVRWALLIVPVLLAWMLLAILPSTAKPTMAGLYRVLMPWRNTLPAMLAQVAVQPGEVTVVQGDSIPILAHVTFAEEARDASHATLIRQFDNGQKLTDEMDRSGPRDYRFPLDNVQQTFRYKVTTDQGDSPWFTATIHPRPQINGIDVRCDYPAYTRLSATTVSGRDGSIEAVVGTRVTLTIHTALPVVLDKSRIVIDEGTPDELILPLRPVAPGKPADYQAQLIVNHSGAYKVRVANEFDLTNTDEPPRSIVAQPDDAPTIVIRSPEPQIRVRPDDTVPVKYEAADDFGITKVEAVIQVDDHPAQTVPVPFSTDDKRNVAGPDFSISVADVLKLQHVSSADRITYQLKVTDNRDPDPQFSFSDRQVLKIDRNESRSYQAKEEQKVAEDLKKAVERAVSQLNREQGEVQPARDVDARQRLEPWHQKQLHQATQELPRTSRDLQKAADEAKGTVFQDVAKKVEQIATRPVRSAAEDAAQADLSADNGQDRKDAATKSVQEITDARDQLQKILNEHQIDNDRRAAEAARDLADAARRQQEAADLMKPHDQVANSRDHQERQQQQEAMHKQEQANQKLRQAMEQAEALRDPKAAETAQKLEDLIRKVEEGEKQQDQAAEQTGKQQAANDIQQAANELAKKQEALNKEIAQSAEQHKDAMQKAGANPPNKDQQNNIVRELNRNNLQPARDQMRGAANQLHQAAQQLKNLSRSNDLHPDSRQQDALNKGQQAQQEAQDQKNQADRAASALNEAARQKDAPKPDDAAIQQARDAARQIEKRAADAQDADAQKLAQSAQQDAQAAERSADEAAHAANHEEAQHDLADAAKDLNKAGQELSDATKSDVAADKARMVKDQQDAARSAADQADAQAKEQDALAKAIDAQQAQLAQVRQNQQAPEQTAQQENQVADNARAAQQQADQLQQQARDAKNPNVARRAEQAKSALAEAQQHATDAAKAQQQAAQSQHEAENAQRADQARAAEQSADKALEQAAQQQQQAQDALAKAEGALRNLPADDKSATANAQENGGRHPDAENGQQNGSQQDQQQAAQAAQEGAQAQQEAAQQNPAAARQAANALNQAAQAMARAIPGLNPENGHDQADQGNEPSQDPAHHSGQSLESKEGIAASDGPPVVVPASVRDIGISQDEWAKLPELTRKDLLNAAQQSGPPAYRQMIKDYYVRVAKMQQTSGNAAR
jgi:hypothetical protein